MSVAFSSFPGVSGSVADARRFVTAAIRLCPRITAPEEVLDRAELIISELATNAIRHTRSGDPGESFAVRVQVDHRGVRAEVRTRAPRLWHCVPRVVTPGDPFAEHGRGLLLVDRLATRWGVLAPWEGGVYFALHWPTGHHGTEAKE
ncbi:ATP-binding protein [Thermobifida halotolerans]|uniref:ATP-binding protein n=1 Tax=Thermobifida halotolerans TaxID=483545 RepID=A0AA97M0L7_9ACTN|nr:ATP-binding protein [Thermobifida halotolerans]UOE21682.1 ATP-binding protein [Thermobifida halotolerans]